MRFTTLSALTAWTEARKAELGMVDDAATTEAMRNKGASRTPEKRELLRRADERARAAGRKPVLAYF
ncbi:MAG: hypothetical protein JOZ42_14780 [Acetobacteraceae bacterium]|nr:hypothetical protein [Acetobacteraceae bacterium]